MANPIINLPFVDGKHSTHKNGADLGMAHGIGIYNILELFCGASMIIIHDYPSKIPIELFSSSLNIIKPYTLW